MCKTAYISNIIATQGSVLKRSDTDCVHAYFSFFIITTQKRLDVMNTGLLPVLAWTLT